MTHILKPDIRAVEESVVHEGFCMALAEAMQFKPAKSKIHLVLGRSFLLVERYDRLIDAHGHRQRLHQADFCQALGVVPEMKYQNEGGPDLAQCFELVRRVTRPSAPQVLRLLDYVIFNALIGNHDVRAKNFSLLYSGKTPFWRRSTTGSSSRLKALLHIARAAVQDHFHANRLPEFAANPGLDQEI